MNDYIVTEWQRLGRRFLCAAFYEDRKLTELQVEDCDRPVLPGRIYRGYTEQVMPHLGGAFAKIGPNERVFIALKKGQKLRASAPVIVMMTDDEEGRKESVATLDVEIAGKWAVASEGEGISFSSRLSKKKREAIRAFFPEEGIKGAHLLIRTNAKDASGDEIVNEARKLAATLKETLERGSSKKEAGLLYEPEPFYVRMLRDLYVRPERVFSDIPSAAEIISKTAGTGQEEPSFYRHPSLSLADAYDLSSDIEKLLGKTYYLKCGGYVTVEETEAFTAVDVNSGKCGHGRRNGLKGKRDELQRVVNTEAAELVFRLIRLRNLSGMILVDFIGAEGGEDDQRLLTFARGEIKKDHIHCEAVDITKLGIMEIIRQKKGRTLGQTVKGD